METTLTALPWIRCGTPRRAYRAAGGTRPVTRAFTAEELLAKGSMDESPDLRLLFHRLKNQRGMRQDDAELLQAKAPDDMNRARASQVVSSALEAMGTAREIRRITDAPADAE